MRTGRGRGPGGASARLRRATSGQSSGGSRHARRPGRARSPFPSPLDRSTVTSSAHCGHLRRRPVGRHRPETKHPRCLSAPPAVSLAPVSLSRTSTTRPISPPKSKSGTRAGRKPLAEGARRAMVASRRRSWALGGVGGRPGPLLPLLGQRPHAAARRMQAHAARRARWPTVSGGRAAGLVAHVERGGKGICVACVRVRARGDRRGNRQPTFFSGMKKCACSVGSCPSTLSTPARPRPTHTYRAPCASLNSASHTHTHALARNVKPPPPSTPSPSSRAVPSPSLPPSLSLSSLTPSPTRP